jgi:hypothetical protein
MNHYPLLGRLAVPAALGLALLLLAAGASTLADVGQESGGRRPQKKQAPPGKRAEEEEEDAPPKKRRPPPRAEGVGEKGPPAKPLDALAALNAASRAAYAWAREAALERGGPVVLVEGDQLVLRHSGRRTAVRYNPPLYHDLKAFSHVPLALHSFLAAAGEGPLGARHLDELEAYRGKMLAARKALPGLKLSKEQRARQEKLLTESLDFLAGVLRRKKLDEKALLAYVRGVRPLLDANAREAARAQIDGLDRQMRAWKAELSEKEWGRLTAVVMGPQMPRKDNLAVQYFARLLGEVGEGRRVVYAEALFDEAKALNLLGTRRVDTRLGKDFFDDPRRMHRDLLGDAAREYLDERLEKKRPAPESRPR